VAASPGRSFSDETPGRGRRESNSDLGSSLFAGAKLPEFLALGCDLQAASSDREAEPMANLIFELFDFVALELDDPFTVLANNMVVLWMLA